jgi:3-methyladenine DNA glycosylase Tag
MAMHRFVIEFQEALDQYLALTKILDQILNADESQDPQALARSIVENQDCLLRFQQMHIRMRGLSKKQEQFRSEFDSVDCEKIATISNTVNVQSHRIQELLRHQEKSVQCHRDQLAKALVDIGKSSRYLKVLTPPKSNYPKFIDSTC